MNNDQVIVEIFEGAPTEKEGVFKNDAGESVAYHTRKQGARLEAGGYAYPYDVRLEKDQRPYPPGRYRLALHRMVQVNKGAHSLAKFAVLEPISTGK